MRGYIRTAIGGATIALDIASEAAESFGPLKAVLGVITAIYTNYEVRLKPPARTLPNRSTYRKL